MPSPKREDGELPASPPRGGADAEMKDREPSPRKPDAADAEDGPSKRKNGGGGGDDDGTDKPPAAEPKRRRIDDGKRSARMFGNILGTLRKFQDDEGKTKKSEAVSSKRSQRGERGERGERTTTYPFPGLLHASHSWLWRLRPGSAVGQRLRAGRRREPS